MTIRTKLAKPVNDLLRPLHVQLVSGTSADPAIKDFLPARKTIAAAENAGLPLGEYIDKTFAQPGATSETIHALLELADLHSTGGTVCEIGPGSGRFAEKIIETLSPRRYEIYETARDWLPRLRQLPNAVIQKCDGRTLSGTADSSVELVHAHKVFPTWISSRPRDISRRWHGWSAPAGSWRSNRDRELPRRRNRQGVGANSLVLPARPAGMGGRVHAAPRSCAARVAPRAAAAARKIGTARIPP